jgi:hypothetical protein
MCYITYAFSIAEEPSIRQIGHCVFYKILFFPAVLVCEHGIDNRLRRAAQAPGIMICGPDIIYVATSASENVH